jgi:hypothetical protein
VVEEFFDIAQGVMGCPECKNKLPFKISADGVS